MFVLNRQKYHLAPIRFEATIRTEEDLTFVVEMSIELI